MRGYRLSLLLRGFGYGNVGYPFRRFRVPIRCFGIYGVGGNWIIALVRGFGCWNLVGDDDVGGEVMHRYRQ